MEEKLRRLMKHEGINSTRLAEILGIQASGISHIMSGRNKPSYDFLLKLLQRFPQINPDWLLLDKGPMYRDEIKNKSGQSASPVVGGLQSAVPSSAGHATLAASSELLSGSVHGGNGAGTGGSNHAGGANTAPKGLFGPDNDDIIPSDRPDRTSLATSAAHSGAHPANTPHAGIPYPVPVGGLARSAAIERIVVFYKDKTFSEYQPE